MGLGVHTVSKWALELELWVHMVLKQSPSVASPSQNSTKLVLKRPQCRQGRLSPQRKQGRWSPQRKQIGHIAFRAAARLLRRWPSSVVRCARPLGSLCEILLAWLPQATINLPACGSLVGHELQTFVLTGEAPADNYQEAKQYYGDGSVRPNVPRVNALQKLGSKRGAWGK